MRAPEPRPIPAQVSLGTQPSSEQSPSWTTPRADHAPHIALLVDRFLTELAPRNDGALSPGDKPDRRFARFLEDGTPRLSPSQVNQILSCPGKWHAEYILGWQSKPSWQASVGTIAHAAMDAYLEGHRTQEVLTAARAAVTDYIDSIHPMAFQNPPGEAETHANRLATAVGNMIGWFEAGEYKRVATEETVVQAFDVDGTEVALMGRYDALIETPAGHRFIVDWKFPGYSQHKPSRETYVYATGTYFQALHGEGEPVAGYAIVSAGQDGGEVYADWYPNPVDRLDWIQERTETAMRRVLANDLPFDPETPGPLCSAKWCTFFGSCPATMAHPAF